MKTRSLTAASLLLLLVSNLLGCGDDEEKKQDGPHEQARYGLSAEEAAQPLATVGNTTITLGDFADEMARQSPYLRGRFQSYEKRKEYLDNMVRFELLAQEAARQGLMKHPNVLREQKKLLEQELIANEIDDKLKAKPIRHDEIKAFYEAHQDEFKKPAQRRISHILLKTQSAANKLLNQLGEVPDDTAFKKAAATQSLDKETGSRFGDTGFHTHPSDRRQGEQSSLPDAVIEAAFELEKRGQVYPKPVKSDGGFHIVRLTAKRDAFSRSLEQAERPIRAQLEKQRRDKALEELTKRLRAEAKVEINDDAVNRLIQEYSK